MHGKARYLCGHATLETVQETLARHVLHAENSTRHTVIPAPTSLSIFHCLKPYSTFQQNFMVDSATLTPFANNIHIKPRTPLPAQP